MGNRLIQLQLALLDQHQRRDGGERLDAAIGVDQRVVTPGLVTLQVRHTRPQIDNSLATDLHTESCPTFLRIVKDRLEGLLNGLKSTCTLPFSFHDQDSIQLSEGP